MIKHFNNMLPTWLYNRVLDQALNPAIEWHFPGNGGYHGDIDKSCFAKMIFDEERNYEDWRNVESLKYALDCWIYQNKDWFKFERLNRCILNFYTPGMTMGWHTDHSKDNHFTLIYYINESDGGTEFEDVKIPHVANSGILLRSKDSHKNIESAVPRRISVAWLIVGTITG
jgi:hypothetical protein